LHPLAGVEKKKFEGTCFLKAKLLIGGTSVDEAKTKFVAIALDPFATRISQRYTQVLHSGVSGNLLLVGFRDILNLFCSFASVPSVKP
jgi:hypothetical protein